MPRKIPTTRKTKAPGPAAKEDAPPTKPAQLRRSGRRVPLGELSRNPTLEENNEEHMADVTEDTASDTDDHSTADDDDEYQEPPPKKTKNLKSNKNNSKTTTRRGGKKSTSTATRKAPPQDAATLPAKKQKQGAKAVKGKRKTGSQGGKTGDITSSPKDSVRATRRKTAIEEIETLGDYGNVSGIVRKPTPSLEAELNCYASDWRCFGAVDY